MRRYDLHCHSTRSDGLLSPADLVRRAASRGVDVLALTDHDEICGLAEARAAAEEAAIRFIDGTELSVSWSDITLHVLALGIDPQCEMLLAGLAKIREGRAQRAKRIGEALTATGIEGAYDGAMAYVTSERLICRTHFARFLVEHGRRLPQSPPSIPAFVPKNQQYSIVKATRLALLLRKVWTRIAL